MIAGSDTGNGAASSLTERSGCSASRITSARRVGSDSAAKVRSSEGSENLTIWFSIKGAGVVNSFVIPDCREAASPESIVTGQRLWILRSLFIGPRDFARCRWLGPGMTLSN
jgi:hypothetical protein